MPKKTFALPSKKSKKNPAGRGGYPMPDRAHAANAKARAKQMLNAGKLSRAAYDRIIARANKILGGKKKK